MPYPILHGEPSFFAWHPAFLDRFHRCPPPFQSKTRRHPLKRRKAAQSCIGVYRVRHPRFLHHLGTSTVSTGRDDVPTSVRATCYSYFLFHSPFFGIGFPELSPPPWLLTSYEFPPFALDLFPPKVFFLFETVKRLRALCSLLFWVLRRFGVCSSFG